MTYQLRGVTIHTIEPVCLRTAIRLAKQINLPAPRKCWFS